MRLKADEMNMDTLSIMALRPCLSMQGWSDLSFLATKRKKNPAQTGRGWVRPCYEQDDQQPSSSLRQSYHRKHKTSLLTAEAQSHTTTPHNQPKT